jgi:bifunctional DNA-binding transcriptional regulator/antitoxin component of YhaV-PrlF toxin-antitoxin module
MYQSTVSIQGQTTIPIQIRDQLGLIPGAQMVWETVQDQLGVSYVRITPSSIQTLKSLRGIGKDLYKKYDSGEKYLEEERLMWDKKST